MALIVAPPPTPNGGLHLGHLSGPYLYADVHRRWCAQHGERTGIWLHTDNSQMYCVNAAKKAGQPVDAFVASRADQIEAHLADAAIELDGLSKAPPPEYTAFVNHFFEQAADSEHISVTRRPFFVDAETREPYADALIKGRCGACLAETSGGICELCGSPNDPVELFEPTSAQGERSLDLHEFDVLTMHLEGFAPFLREHLLGSRYVLRPRLRALTERLLSEPLPDVPLTLPGRWGVPVEMKGLQGQVFNPWAEILPGHILHSQALPAASRWSSDTGPRLFFGFDNSFFYVFLHAALIEASNGRYAQAESYVTNEFYELEGEKFSSSLGHVVWIDDGVREFGVDALRYYICRTNPMYQRANFVREEAHHAIVTGLVDPLRALLTARDALLGKPATTWRRLPLEPAEAEMRSHYDLRVMDLRAVTSRLDNLLRVLVREAEAAVRAGDGGALVTIDAGLALWAQLALPVMPTMAGRIKDALLGPAHRNKYLDYPTLLEVTHQTPLAFADVTAGVCL